MKNTLLFAPLQYRYSQLQDKNLTIGLIWYVKNEGEIQFLEGEGELTQLQNTFPNLKRSLIDAYMDLIHKKIQKYPPDKHLEREDFEQYLHKYILSPDDSTLQFGAVGMRPNLNGDLEKKITDCKHTYLPYTFGSKSILQKFDTLFEQHLPKHADSFIHKNESIVVNSPMDLQCDRSWNISDTSYFLWAMNLNVNDPNKVIEKNIQKWRNLLQLSLDFAFEIHIWLIPPNDEAKLTNYIETIQKELHPLTTRILLPIQWVEYTKEVVKNYLNAKKAQIFYISLPDDWRKEEKLQWFKENSFKTIAFQKIIPDKNYNWLNTADENDWENLLPICSKDKGQNTIFGFSSLGVSTNRDEWVYDFNKVALQNKITFFIDKYNDLLERNDDSWNTSIKWSRDLKNKFEQRKIIFFDKKKLIISNYRPFTTRFLYVENILIDRLTQNHRAFFGEKLEEKNYVININTNSTHLSYFISNSLSDLHFLGDNHCLPLYYYEKEKRKDNITDWALSQFTVHYKDENINKEAIFHYVYAVLHNPAYRQKYEQNLKRDFPRIPFYQDFGQWAKWGKALMDLHIGYEEVEPFALTRKEIKPKQPKVKAPNLLTDLEAPKALFEEEAAYTFVPKAKLKAHKDEGTIEIDELTTLSGIPAEAWEYKLGNRTALEWILDQYKESKPSDPTIAEKFNTYKFADYKEQVIDLLQRVCTVSVETIKIVREMQEKLK